MIALSELSAGFMQICRREPGANTPPDESAWHIVDQTGDKPAKNPF